MENISAQLVLTTKYGQASFGLTVYEDGTVDVSELPFQHLPESVYKLTYGSDWAVVCEYFKSLAATLPYRVSATLLSPQPPPELLGVVSAYRAAFPSPECYGPFTEFWARHPKQHGLFSFRDDRVNAALDALRQRGRQRNLEKFGPYLQDYLIALLPIANHRTTVYVYAAIGALGTEAARDYLLKELESEGRHPFTNKILRALTFASDADTFHRLVAVYRAGKFSTEEVLQHLLFLGRFGSELALDHVRELLSAYPTEAEAIGRTLGDLGLTEAEIAQLLTAEFERQREYYALDPLLRAVNRRQVAGHRIDLAAMNAKADDPAFLELPPVNWPQQLEEGWRELVADTPASEVYEVLGHYIVRPEPRLQRNAILQLKASRSRTPTDDRLPYEIERRLRELVASRYDKIYVEVLNILGGNPLVLRERKKMLLAVLNISIGSRYRFVVLNALRMIGDTDTLRQFSRAYYGREIATAPVGSERLQQIAGLLPYLDKYLGNTEDLHTALKARRSSRS
ncbi:hypothetical protein GGR28_000778 [Lewinella aquimaris]|uniref:Uncharacterized protein n=1 Tax=Neolewinella aquimaris TaxID=1835722 RepID=A0A840E4X2_9BACT|nr:hypothetical protein [Neolewinella aquimaris]MBB4078177.1 hypothetical protein [Neolewinella aquimaris]